MVERERFVPQRVRALTTDLAALPFGDPDDAERFGAFARLVASLYHFEFHEREQSLVELWDRLSPAPSAPVAAFPGAGAAPVDVRTAAEFTADLTGILDGANYEPLTMADLEDALEHESLLKLRLHVDLDDYEELLVYRRGGHAETVDIVRWRGLRSPEQRTITVDERVVVHTRVQPASYFAERGIDPVERNLIPGHVSLKQFERVPRADVEMLLPSTQVRFRRIDQLAVGVPALASGILVLSTKLLPTFALMFVLVAAWLGFRDDEPELDQAALVLLMTGLAAIGGFVVRQWTKLKNRRIDYLKTLTENLYFRTLGTGGGVLHDLLAAAEEQEVVEVVLGYRFLLAAARGGLTSDELDARVEAWLTDQCDRDVDFEVDDALGKLERLGVVERRRDRIVAVPVGAALVRLDRRWDDLFAFNNSSVPDSGADAASADAGAEGDGWRTASLIRLRQVVGEFRSRLGGRSVRREGSTDGAAEPDTAHGSDDPAAPAPTERR